MASVDWLSVCRLDGRIEKCRGVKMSYQSIKIGIQQDKSLSIDFPELGGTKSSLVISSFSKGVDWCLYVDNEEPEFMSYLSEAAVCLEFLEKTAEGCEWLRDIPEEIMIRLGNRYQGMEFIILYHVMKYPAAYDLFVANPTLLWYMLFVAKKECWEEKKVAALLKLKCKEILTECRVPGTSSAVKLLKDLSFKQFDLVGFFKIQEGLRLPNYLQLNHHEKLDYRVFDILVRHPELIASSIMLKYDADTWQYKTEARFLQIKSLAQSLGEIEACKKQLNKCQNHLQVEKVYNKLIKKRRFKNMLRNLPENNFPKPPVEGNDWIVPLCGSRDLALEAQEMKHCARAYENAIIKGTYFIYKVLTPERATLGVELHKNNSPPSVDQLVSYCNDSLKLEVLHDHIHHWLYDQDKAPYFQDLLKRVNTIRFSEKTFLRKLLLLARYTIDYCSEETLKSTFLSTLEGKLHWALEGDSDADKKGFFLTQDTSSSKCFEVFDFLTPEMPELETKIINEKFTVKDIRVIDDLVNKCLQVFEQNLKDFDELRMHSFIFTIDSHLHSLWLERILDNGVRMDN